MFSLFGSKRELFLAAVERGFELVAEWFREAAAEFDPATAPPDIDLLKAMGNAYVELLSTERDYLMLQLQAYAACDDDVIRDRVRGWYAELVSDVEELTGADSERIDDFFRYGMWLNVAAAMGVEDLSAGCEWISGRSRRAHPAPPPASSPSPSRSQSDPPPVAGAALCFWKPTGAISDGRRGSWRSVPWGPGPAVPAQPAARDSG